MLIKKIEEVHNNNSYISVNAFKNEKRNQKNLMQIRSVYIDLDIMDTNFFNYASELANKNHEHSNSLDVVKYINEQVHNLYIKKINEILYKEKLPQPSKINFTGGGYHIYWHLQTLKDDEVKFNGASYKIKHVYKYIQKKMVDIFLELGADPACVDSTRLLRPEGSYNTKRHEITTTVKKNDSKYLLKEFTHILNYTLEEVIKYKSITEKQLFFIENNNIKYHKNDPKSLSKKEATTLIKNFIDGEKKATKKQIETLNKYNHEYQKNITVSEANEIIQQSKPKTDYIYSILTRAFNNNDISEGNRSLFNFYMAISHRRTGKLKKESLEKLIEYNKKLGLKEEEVDAICNSAYRDDIKTLNIKKETIITQLNLGDKYLKKKVKRAKKVKISEIEDKLLKEFHNLEKLSARKLAVKFNISKSKSNTLKKKIKEIIKIKKLKSKNQFDKNIKGIKEIILQIIQMCPQIKNNKPRTTINTE